MASSMGPGKMITDGLVLHLDAANTKSYPGSGTTWTDLSQTAITGSLTNGPTFSSVNGGGIIFDGTNDYVEVGNNLNSYVSVSKSLSIETVVTIVSNSSNNTIVATGWDTAGFNFRKLTTNGIRFIYLQDGTKYCGYDSSVLLGGTYHITATFGGSNVNNTGSYNLYVNGILNNSSSIQSGTIVSVEPSRSFSIGSIVDSLNGRQGYYSGSIHSVKLYNRALTANEVFQNYEATRERFNRPTIVTDDDARNFLNSANISSETQQRAVNDLVVDMKNVGLWGKMKAIYPFVGGTAASHKWNLKDPRDVDAAFRLTFSGGWTHSSTGADPNGTTGYADTFLVPSTHLSQNSSHISYYSRNARSVGDSVVIGSTNASLTNRIAIQLNLSGLTYVLVNGTSPNDWVTIADTVETGYYIGYRNSATIVRGQRNNTQYSANVNSTGLTSRNIYIGAYNNNGTAGFYADNQCAFATIGDGLTDTDAANLYTIVQKYQTTLGRQV